MNGEVTIVSEVEVSGPESPRIEQDAGSNSTSQVCHETFHFLSPPRITHYSNDIKYVLSISYQ